MLMAGRLVDGRLRVCTRVGGTANVRGNWTSSLCISFVLRSVHTGCL